MLGFRVIPAVAALWLPLAASAEVLCALGPGASAYKPDSDERPSPDTMQIVRRVDAAYKPICLPKCPEAGMLRNATAPNLALLADSHGAKIVYAPAFFSSVYSKYGEDGIFALIAHVYGHAIDEVTRQPWLPGSWNLELRADAWAGCALAKNGAPASGITPALGALAMYPPAGKASWSPRARAVRLGYNHCGGEAANFDAALKGTQTR